MTLTTLDPNTALVVVDLQTGILSRPLTRPIAPVVAHAAELASRFRHHGLPVVLVNVDGVAPGRTEQPRFSGPMPDGWTDLVAELDRQPSDHLVTKRSWGAFAGTDLADILRNHGVTQLVIVGVATSIGVESTAREAHARGLHVTLAIDAMADLSEAAHENSVARIFPRLGETGSTAEIIAMLESTRA